MESLKFNELNLLGQHGSVEKALTKVLKAKLTPTLTVEVASNLATHAGKKCKPISAEVEEMHFNILKAAGLVALPPGTLPAGIVIENPVAFSRKFPELRDLIRVMYAYEGVQPYTKGRPRRAKAKGLQRMKSTAA